MTLKLLTTPRHHDTRPAVRRWVCVLEMYGLPYEILNALEHAGWYRIQDLQAPGTREDLEAAGFGTKQINYVCRALRAYLVACETGRHAQVVAKWDAWAADIRRQAAEIRRQKGEMPHASDR